MRRAVALAWRGWGRVQPNPLVGAVVLRDGEVVGEGWHAEYGGAHAERVALAAAGERARGATLVVTLEPCAHQGKQPPCADLVLASGVRRVVAALADPNPVAQGGAAWLRAHGVDVEIGIEGEAAAAQNAVFLHAHRNPERPFVAVKLATSLDGKIADSSGRSRWLSGPEAREWVQWLRAGFDAIGVGAATARADDPSLTVRGAVRPRRPPVRLVFDRHAALSPDSALARTAREVPTVVLAAPGGPQAPEGGSPMAAAAHPGGTDASGAGRLAALRSRGVEIVEAEGLAQQLRILRGRGIESLLIEGGGRLAGALLAARCVDRFYRVETPCWLGDGGVPAFAGVPDAPIGAAPPWRVAERRALGADTLLVVDAPPDRS
jgi:diaminohydroxyphosphoribosylaminopyrimidine deaminase/5-amino-6-(5-phosphoribosylamino)uracil reductase